ncbi:permease [Clostridium tetani]|uniref:Permease n=1 Tax=Clostridium tetani TaxID=1513 RepID=A0A4V1LF01_CLOTA|nr:permease [Clostridium tetani]RXI50486.1 permease [Clostridium tetani]BDR66495.1 permease [Clostridium tetani]BDR71997.1 permease [Clostridium tetani]BDR80471.1 permease [Clostridium tetani]BDR88926.1 permease [Clostridium tetani]
MDIFTLSLWITTCIAFIISMIKDKHKTLNSMTMAKGMMKNMIGEIIAILFLIGLILTFIPPETIKSVAEKANVFLSTIISAIVGSITLIPAFVAFPLVGSLVDAGISIMPSVAFLTTLTMVGLITFSLEKEEFGKKFTITRNILSFIFAVIISLAMGVVM